MVWDVCQSFFRVLTQISPLTETLGWNMLVSNQPVQGGLALSEQRVRMYVSDIWEERQAIRDRSGNGF